MTQYVIVSMCIANDSSCVIGVTKRNDFLSYIVIYCLKTYQIIVEEKIEGEFIKTKEVE